MSMPVIVMRRMSVFIMRTVQNRMRRRMRIMHAMLVMRGARVETRRAMEGHEEQPERIERRDEYADHHAPVSVGRDRIVRVQVMLVLHGIDDQILRVVPREKRRTDERERTDPAC